MPPARKDSRLTGHGARRTCRAMPSDTTPDSLIPYDAIVQEALRAVVGRVLREVEDAGGNLPGGHHFYITFKTGAAGVTVPANLRARFPDEMTIVLQNKFWDLKVTDEGFSVGLSFDQIPTRLVVPYGAITHFIDPAVDFGLQFQATAPEAQVEPTQPAGNDGAEPAAGAGVEGEGGSNVVQIDFGRKK